MYSSLIPYAAFTAFTPALPEFYWDVYSAEQRIKHICFELCKLHAYSDYLCQRINELGEDLEDELNAIRQEIKNWENDFRDEIIRLLSELEKGTLQWDVQLGKYTTTVEAQRDMFNDVTVHAYNNAQLESIFNDLNYTVEQLANCGLNVKGYALMNHLLAKPNGITNDLIPSGDTKHKYTVNDLMNSMLDLDGYVYTESGE